MPHYWNQGNGWTITKSYIDGKITVSKRDNETVPFNLLDDDQNTYFDGFMSEALYDSAAILDPLDGMSASYGCVTMKVLGEIIN